ncbi:MAG: zinc dependent phospholipase C family protein [Bacilli bacterium]|jgi:hypothetical protein
MPASLTHYTFVRNNTARDTFSKARYLGGQGPDVFFFYGNAHKKRSDKKILQGFGSKLHHMDIGPAYSFLVDYAQKSDDKEILFAYLEGLFAHYVLDRNVHPYVFYRTGFSTDESRAKDYLLSHVAFETILDVAYARKMETFQNPKRSIACPKRWVDEISKMFYALSIQMNYQGLTELTYSLAYRDMRTVLGILYSPLGIKKAFLNAFKKKTVANCMSMPLSIKKYDYIDIMNNKKTTWGNVLDNSRRNESFDELVFKASNELDYIKKLLNKAQSGENISKEICEFVHNINHDGIPNGEQMKYFTLCWISSD